jgi:hypothetical protein
MKTIISTDLQDSCKSLPLELMPKRKCIGINIEYKNHRGETAIRHIEPRIFRYGMTSWHPESQWFLYAWDFDKWGFRYFSVNNFIITEELKPLLKDITVAGNKNLHSLMQLLK